VYLPGSSWRCLRAAAGGARAPDPSESKRGRRRLETHSQQSTAYKQAQPTSAAWMRGRSKVSAGLRGLCTQMPRRHAGQPLHSIMHHASWHILEGLYGGAVQSLAGRPARTRRAKHKVAPKLRVIARSAARSRHAGHVQGKPWAPLALRATLRSCTETQLFTRARRYALQARRARARRSSPGAYPRPWAPWC